jgi:ATP-dependent DNA helicase RecG
MRSEKINPLFATISSLSGVGPKIEKLFNKIVGNRLVNLLWHLPYNVIKRKKHKNIRNAEINSLVIFKIKIIEHRPSRFKKQPYKVNCLCGEEPIDIVFFFAKHPYIKSILPIGEERLISGKLEYFRNKYQCTHPSHIIKIDSINEIKEIEPIYGLTAGLTQKIYLKTFNNVIKKLPDLEEWIDSDIINKFSFEEWKRSLINIHNPKSNEDILPNNVFRRRLAYDELLAHQLAISIVRNYNKKQKGIKFIDNSELVNKCIKKLPFTLTNSQKNAWKQISDDLKSENQMVRLLQGDVGAGKTIVALLAMLQAIDSGYQASLMVPTAILAYQHYDTLNNLLSNMKIKIILLTSKDIGKSRLEKIELIKNGEAKLIIGTTSLIQEDVKYNSIGIVVIDEQHKFGVFQKLAFSNKGTKPSLLVMSATPIPRTLSLAAYGDMDETKLIDKPTGRLPIITKSVPIAKVNSLIDRLVNIFNRQEKIFWVCPLIEESEELDIQAATERYKILENKFKGKVLLLHGQLKETEKENIMKKFKEEDYRIMVSTTVLEVGIDIKEATTLIIEHAERYGLATLHQIRGRIGRGNIQSTCILLYKENMGENAKKRIKKMKETNNGFEIAEKDLQIRGPGEVLGKKQSGLPSFLIADLYFDSDLLEIARKKVDLIALTDPNLKSKKGLNLRNLLYLFERDIAIKTLLSG